MKNAKDSELNLMDSLERNSNLGKIQPWNREFKDAEKKPRDEFGDRGFYSTQT